MYQPIESQAFITLADQIDHEHDMLATSAAALEVSHLSGLAGVIYEENQIVAYARLIPLLDTSIKDALGLPEESPNVYELGSVWVHPDFRHNSHGRNYANEVLEQVYQTVATLNSEGDVVIGTALNIKMIKKLKLALPFTNVSLISRHNNGYSYDPLAALTCVCDKPEDGKLGVQYGMQRCEIRTPNSQILNIGRLEEAIESKDLLIGEEGALDGCYMFILSPQKQINNLYATVMNHFGRDGNDFLPHDQAMNNFIQALKSNIYYGMPSAEFD